MVLQLTSALFLSTPCKTSFFSKQLCNKHLFFPYLEEAERLLQQKEFLPILAAKNFFENVSCLFTIWVIL